MVEVALFRRANLLKSKVNTHLPINKTEERTHLPASRQPSRLPQPLKVVKGPQALHRHKEGIKITSRSQRGRIEVTLRLFLGCFIAVKFVRMDQVLEDHNTAHRSPCYSCGYSASGEQVCN